METEDDDDEEEEQQKQETRAWGRRTRVVAISAWLPAGLCSLQGSKEGEAWEERHIWTLVTFG